jgi:DNA polymerase III subunit beta
MHFSIERDLLFKLLRCALGIVDKKLDLKNIGAQIFLQIHDGCIRLLASDRDLDLTCQDKFYDQSIDYQVFVPFRKIYEICRNLSDNSVINIIALANKLHLECGDGKYEVSLMGQELFPSVSVPICNANFSVSRDILARALTAVNFVMVEQELRSFVNGMLFEWSENLLTLVTTDGHRLGEVSVAAQVSLTSVLRCVVPRRTIAELLRLLPDFAEQISIGLNDKQISFFDQRIYLTSRLLTGNFPGHLHLVHPVNTRVISCERLKLRDALLRVTALFFDDFYRLELKIMPKQLCLTATTPDNDILVENIPINYNGDPFEVRFNGRYIIDAINHLNITVLELVFAVNDIVLFTDPQQKVKYVVMPLVE